MNTVKARIRDDGRGAMVEAQRGKYKHWFPIGIHAETDRAFKAALATGKLVWSPEILGPAKLFEKKCANFRKKFWKYKNYPYLCTGLRK